MVFQEIYIFCDFCYDECYKIYFDLIMLFVQGSHTTGGTTILVALFFGHQMWRYGVLEGGP